MFLVQLLAVRRLQIVPFEPYREGSAEKEAGKRESARERTQNHRQAAVGSARRAHCGGLNILLNQQ